MTEDKNLDSVPSIPGAEITKGTLEFNSFNIPVNISLYPETDEEGRPTGYYAISTGNYAPVNDDLNLDRHMARSRDPEVIRAIVRERILPIYETAVEQLKAIADGKADHLHSWEREDREEELT